MTETTDRGSLRAVVDAPEELLERAGRAPEPTEFVVTPERLHRRNLKRRLARRATPRSNLWLTDAAAIAARLVDAGGVASETIDRIDRLNHLETLLRRDTDANDRLRAAVGSDLPARVETVAAAHSRVAEMTGWDEGRVDALSSLAEDLPAVAARDTADVLAGVRALERGLRDRVGDVHSRETLLPAGADALRERPELWTEVFPAAERLWVAGVSAVDAPLLSLLDAAMAAGVDVTLSLRPGTGPAIADRLPARLPDDAAFSADSYEASAGSTVPAAELVADTPEAEARLAAAVVAGHLRNGVSPSDVLVVARDAAEYERHLRRALDRHDVPVAVWAQLPVEHTVPYRQFAAVCTLLGSDEPTLDELLAPLEFDWVPPESAVEHTDSTPWPLSTERVGALRGVLADDSGSEQPGLTVEGWVDRLSDAVKGNDLSRERGRPLRRFLDWVGEQPEMPEPAALHGTFEPLVEAGREVALSAVFESDSSDLTRTSRYARALSRIEELLTDTRAKYREWLEAGDVPRSWLAVADLAERVVTTRPGRREHANAAAVDVIDATDAWLREAPHVVALGMVDGVWPRRVESVFPEPLRQAVVDGDGAAARRLAVPGRWTAAREADHLASGLGAATETLACTRYRRDREGTTQERSPLLADVPTRSVDGEATQSLLATGTLPDALAADGGGSR
jgi:ATP-dependent helicase/nuclease subunit B